MKNIFNFEEKDLKIIENVAETFLEKGDSSTPPQFVILTGGVASGKTTIRRQKFGKDFVHVDYGDVYTSLKKKINLDETNLLKAAFQATNNILYECLISQFNIVTEVIGDNESALTPIIDEMRELGYKVSVNFIECDPVIAYQRHLKAVKEYPDYWSANFTQDSTILVFCQQLGLSAPPNI